MDRPELAETLDEESAALYEIAAVLRYEEKTGQPVEPGSFFLGRCSRAGYVEELEPEELVRRAGAVRDLYVTMTRQLGFDRPN